MLRKVIITDKASRQIIAEYQINLEIVYPLPEDYFDEAWMKALMEGLIKDPKSNYKIEISEASSN